MHNIHVKEFVSLYTKEHLQQATCHTHLHAASCPALYCIDCNEGRDDVFRNLKVGFKTTPHKLRFNVVAAAVVGLARCFSVITANTAFPHGQRA